MFRLLALTVCFTCVLAKLTIHPDDFIRFIVGGETTTIEIRPFQLALLVDDAFYCGASLYKKNIALTAAHCVAKYHRKQLKVRGGSTRWQSGGETLGVRKFIIHEEYTSADIDIALLFLDGDFEYSDQIQPIQLPTSSPVEGTDVDVSGWGTVDPSIRILTITLRSVTVQIVNMEDCRKAYTDIPMEGKICAGVKLGGKDACYGDSGGPLTIGKTQVGIVSFGKGCGLPEYPGVYTNVAELVPWIKNMTST